MKKLFVILFLLCCVSSINSFACLRQNFGAVEYNVATVNVLSIQKHSYNELFAATQVREHKTYQRAYQVLNFSKTEDVPVDMAADIATFTKIVFTFWYPFVENSDAEGEQYLIAQKHYVIPNLIDKPVVYQTFLI